MDESRQSVSTPADDIMAIAYRLQTRTPGRTRWVTVSDYWTKEAAISESRAWSDSNNVRVLEINSAVVFSSTRE